MNSQIWKIGEMALLICCVLFQLISLANQVLHIAPTLYFLEASLRYNLFFGIIDSPAQIDDLNPEVLERPYLRFVQL